MSLIHIQNLTKGTDHGRGVRPALPAFSAPEEVFPLVYFFPVVGIGLFTLTYWISTKGVNSYTGTGS